MSTGLTNRCSRRLRSSVAFAVPMGLVLFGAEPAMAQVPAPDQTAPQSSQPQVYEPAYFARFAPKTAQDMVGNIPGFQISGNDDEERGFGQAKQNVLLNGRRVSGKSNDAATALGRIAADSVIRIEIVDGATLNIPGLSGQVVNIIAKVKAFGGTWNQKSEFRENMAPTWFTGGLNANGKAGGWSWSAGFELNEFHNGHDGPTVVTGGDGVVRDIRRESFAGEGDEPSINGTLTYEAVDGAIANVNVSLGASNFHGHEDSYRRPFAPTADFPHENVFLMIGEDDREAEIGADYEFDLGPGRLKLIALQRLFDEKNKFTFESWRSLTDIEGVRAQDHATGGESIARAEYGFGAFGGDLQWAGEGAFNYGEVEGGFAGQREPDGSYNLVGLFGLSARIEERRAETNLSFSRKLSPAWSLQSSLGVEYSQIGVEFAQADASQTQQPPDVLSPPKRDFVRPKGFLALVWKANDTLDISLKGERKVGQLDFGDFVASNDVENGSNTGQNAELVPEQSWIASTEINQKLGPWGGVKVGLEARLVEDVIDAFPVGASGQAIGNIGEATAWQASTSGTINFDPVGWKGWQFAFSARYADSEVDDPLTGVRRELSRQQVFSGDMSVRWDIPDTNWTLLAGIEESRNTANFRLDQVSYDWQAPATDFYFIENKDVFGAKVRLQLVNTNDSSENNKLVFYPGGRRTNPIDRIEEAHRTFGPIVRLFVSGTF